MHLASPHSNCRLFFLFGVILLISYSNSFQVVWQYDDKPNILHNQRIQLTELSISQIKQSFFTRPGSGDLYRPVSCLTLALNWYFGQDDVLGYHVVNFLIHYCSTLLLFLTIKALLSTPVLYGRYPPRAIIFISAFATLLWALNPIQTQAVTYIVQRMASLAALFSIATILFYLKARLSENRANQLLCLFFSTISYLLAIFSKENATTVILCLPLIEFLFFQNFVSKKLTRHLIAATILGMFIALLGGLALRPELFDFILNYYDQRPFTLSERVLTEQRIIPYYLSQLLFPSPHRLSLEHDIILSSSIFAPWSTSISILFNCLLVFLAVKLARKQPLISFAILFYYINHLVESTALPLELFFEHRNYLPSLFLFVPVALLLFKLISKFEMKKIATSSVAVIIIMLFISLGYATYQRNIVWRTEESLWLDAAQKAPKSARPLSALAIKLGWGPEPSEKKYRKALELTARTLSMQSTRRRLDAAQLANMASLHQKLHEYELSIDYYKQALTIAPEDVNIRFNLCKSLITIGDFRGAEKEIEGLLHKRFIRADFLNMLGFIRLKLQQPERALPALQEALRLAPNRPDTLLYLGKCLSQLGYHQRASWFFSLSQKYGGRNAALSLCIIENLVRDSRFQQAQEEFHHAINRYSLVTLLQPLDQTSDKIHNSIPIDKEVILTYLKSELPLLTSEMLK